MADAENWPFRFRSTQAARLDSFVDIHRHLLEERSLEVISDFNPQDDVLGPGLDEEWPGELGQERAARGFAFSAPFQECPECHRGPEYHLRQVRGGDGHAG